MAVTYYLKRGDTWEEETTVYWDDGASVPADLTGWTPSAGVKHSSGVSGTVTATITDAAAGRVRISATAAETAGWTPGLWRGDIQFSDGSDVVRSTETFHLIVEEDYAQ